MYVTASYTQLTQFYQDKKGKVAVRFNKTTLPSKFLECLSLHKHAEVPVCSSLYVQTLMQLGILGFAVGPAVGGGLQEVCEKVH